MLVDGVIALHIVAGLSAAIFGAAAMRAPKRPGRHPHRGRIYLLALFVVGLTATGIAIARPHTAYLLLPGGLASAAGALGYFARRIRWHGWLRHHITGMAVSYIALLTTFYVDNGPRLPLWKQPPPLTFWFLPAAIGLPLVIRALHRHSTPRCQPTRPHEGDPHVTDLNNSATGTDPAFERH